MNKQNYFNTEFISTMMKNSKPNSEIEVFELEQFDIDNSASILVTLTSASSDEFIGHFGLKVSYSIDGIHQTRNLVMKVKPKGKAISDMLNGLSQLCSEEVYAQYNTVKDLTGFHDTHDKEIIIYNEYNSPIFPEIFGYYINEKENVYALLMEYFEDVVMLNSVMDTTLWTKEKIQIGVDAIINWHKESIGKTDWYKNKFKDYRTSTQIKKLQATWEVLLDNASTRFPNLYSEDLKLKLQKGIQDFPMLWDSMENVNKSIIHNDFNPRNSFFRINDNVLNICVYDWELANIHFPVYDLVEFLSFTGNNLNDEELTDTLEYFGAEISKVCDDYKYEKIFQLSLLCSTYDFGLHRLGMYMMAHSVSPYPFIPHVIKNYSRILNYVLAKS